MRVEDACAIQLRHGGMLKKEAEREMVHLTGVEPALCWV